MSRNVKDAIASALQMLLFTLCFLHPVWLRVYPDLYTGLPDASAWPEWAVSCAFWLVPVIVALFGFLASLLIDWLISRYFPPKVSSDHDSKKSRKR